MSRPSVRIQLAAPIRKGTSQPQDTNEPSFLTTLPPEIRNAIYECLYLHTGPVNIVDAHEYTKPSTAVQDDDDDHFDNHDADDDGYGNLDERVKAHDSHIPVSFLRTCRQIYGESSGKLYGANNFIISVATHRHNGGFRQARTAVRWLKGLGSQSQLLSKVSIDVGKQCPMGCYYDETEYNLGPLIKHLWSSVGSKMRLEFTDSGKELDAGSHSHPTLPSVSVSSATLATRMGNIFESLFVKDTFALRRYARFDGLIAGIYINKDLLHGAIIFASDGRGTPRLDDATLRFTMINGCIPSAPSPRPEPYSESKMPPLGNGASRLALEYAISSQEPVILDLRRTLLNTNIALFHVNKSWRKLAQ
jgi:hypothetical protein